MELSEKQLEVPKMLASKYLLVGSLHNSVSATVVYVEFTH